MPECGFSPRSPRRRSSPPFSAGGAVFRASLERSAESPPDWLALRCPPTQGSWLRTRRCRSGRSPAGSCRFFSPPPRWPAPGRLWISPPTTRAPAKSPIRSAPSAAPPNWFLRRSWKGRPRGSAIAWPARFSTAPAARFGKRRECSPPEASCSPCCPENRRRRESPPMFWDWRDRYVSASACIAPASPPRAMRGRRSASRGRNWKTAIPADLRLRSAKVAELPPEFRPALLQAAADKDIRVIGGLFVPHTEAVPNLRRDLAGLKIALEEIPREAGGDHHLRGRIAVASGPKRIDATDRPREPVAGSVEIDRSRLAIVPRKNSQMLALPGGQRIADPRHGLDQIRPSDLLEKIAVDPARDLEPARIDGSDRERK